MLDINLFRKDKGGNPDLIRESEKRRNGDVTRIDRVIALDEEWIKLRFDVDQENKKINALNKTLGARFKAKENADDLLKEKENILKFKADIEVLMTAKEEERDAVLKSIGNLVHDSVIVSNDEDNNAVVREWLPKGVTELRKKANLLAHDQVLDRIGGYDPDRGSKVAGHRGFFLLDAGLELNQALISYGLDFLKKRDYTKIMTPFFMKKEMMAKTAQLSQFDEELYKVVEKERGAAAKEAEGEKVEESEDKYLIATSEQPISCFHSGETFNQPEKQLPIKYAGYSTCFRKEAGSSGRDTWGIFRIHQFEKVEQFCLTEPEKSWEMFDQMIAHSEDFYQSLGLPYRIVSIVSGALNNAAAKKYDLEAWFPFQQAHKELVSCSNCTDYQSRRLDIRCGQKKMNQTEKKFVHLLNSTLTATERTICCILENHQDPEAGGVHIPEPLRPYMGGRDFLPYIAPARKRIEKN